jgi:acetolactate synthase regulatory subunit
MGGLGEDVAGMQRSLTIDTEAELIVICRLLNIFRRKGVRLTNLVMSSTSEGFRVAVRFEAAQTEIDHLFNFVRRTEGVSHVATEETASVLESLSQVT